MKLYGIRRLEPQPLHSRSQKQLSEWQVECLSVWCVWVPDIRPVKLVHQHAAARTRV